MIRSVILLLAVTAHTVAVVLYLMAGRPGEAGVLITSNVVTALAVWGWIRYRPSRQRLDR